MVRNFIYVVCQYSIMPAIKTTQKEILHLYEELLQITKNFKQIKPEVIMENPKRLLVLRLCLEQSQTQFEKCVGNIAKNLTKYECGKIRTMQYRTAERIVEKIKGRISVIGEKDLIKNFRKNKAESEGWFKANSDSVKVLAARRKGASRSMLLRRTEQEKKIESILIKLGIKYSANHTLNPNIIVDFYFPKRRIVLEVKKLTTKSRREIVEQTQKLAYQGYKIKYKFPRFKLWALIESETPISLRDREELQGPFDRVFEKHVFVGQALSS